MTKNPKKQTAIIVKAPEELKKPVKENDEMIGIDPEDINKIYLIFCKI